MGVVGRGRKYCFGGTIRGLVDNQQKQLKGGFQNYIYQKKYGRQTFYGLVG